ncbi:MAG: hypothetical protein ACYDBT_14985 [Desulfobulbaceae bacterium]
MIGMEGAAPVGNRWFTERRDFFVRQLVDEFFLLQRSFQETYLVYLDCRDPGKWACSDLLAQRFRAQRTELWQRLAGLVGSESEKGPLWRLKDLCHLLWPESNEEGEVSGSLLDWLIGSIFHETMKLKEDSYLLNSYGPAACRLQHRPLDLVVSFRGGAPSAPTLESIIDVHGLVSRAAGDAVRLMEQVAYLFNHASYLLRVMMPSLAANALVVRLLVEREQVVRIVWGEELAEIFQDMYCGDAAEGFCMAGRSYLAGQWFIQALKAYQRALSVNPTCDEAITRMVQLQAVVRENRELLGAA